MSISQDILFLLSKEKSLCIEEICERMPGYTKEQMQRNVSYCRTCGMLTSKMKTGIAFYSITDLGLSRLKISAISQRSKMRELGGPKLPPAPKLLGLEAAWPYPAMGGAA